MHYFHFLPFFLEVFEINLLGNFNTCNLFFFYNIVRLKYLLIKEGNGNTDRKTLCQIFEKMTYFISSKKVNILCYELEPVLYLFIKP